MQNKFQIKWITIFVSHNNRLIGIYKGKKQKYIAKHEMIFSTHPANK